MYNDISDDMSDDMSDAVNNEIINNNVTVIAITEILECPICLINIVDDNPYYIMTCCKNKLHLHCLINWYSKHSKQKTCFMCNQTNNFFIDFLATDNQSSNNINDTSNIIIESSESNNATSMEYLSAPMLNRTNLSNNRICNCVGFIVSIILGGIALIIIFSSIII